jgi:hypothetical protein
VLHRFGQDFGRLGDHLAGSGDGGDVVGCDGGFFGVRTDGDCGGLDGRGDWLWCDLGLLDINFRRSLRFEDGRALAILAARQRIDAVGGRRILRLVLGFGLQACFWYSDGRFGGGCSFKGGGFWRYGDGLVPLLNGLYGCGWLRVLGVFFRLGLVAEVGAAVTAAVAGIAIVAAGTRVTPGVAIVVAAGLLIGTRIRRAAPREGFPGEDVAAVPALGNSVEVGRWREGDGNCGHGCMRAGRGRGSCRLVVALAVLRERLAGEDDRLADRAGVGVGIGVGDGARAAGLSAKAVAFGRRLESTGATGFAAATLIAARIGAASSAAVVTPGAVV